MQKKKKEKWSKPKLIILIRGNPEERVLAQCKGGVDGSPVSSNNSCAARDCATYKCISYTITCNSDCSAWGVS